MTIIAAVKTGTDLVVAADSKVTTLGLGGIDPSGNPIWLEQTYDFSTKIAFSPGNFWTVAIAGQGSFGDIQVSDIVKSYNAQPFTTRKEQDIDLIKLVSDMDTIRTSKYEEVGVSKENIPLTNLLFFSSDPEGRSARAWDVNWGSSDPQVLEILTMPNVYLAGSCNDVITLLYGYCFAWIDEVATAIEVPGEKIRNALNEKTLPPIRKLNLGVMPLQDAIDFAVFLVKVQIQMKRFLPGNPNCGGPIDIAVIYGLPRHEIKWMPGKEIKHPGSV